MKNENMKFKQKAIIFNVRLTNFFLFKYISGNLVVFNN